MKRLAIYDFDGTLMQSPESAEGRKIWKEKTGEEYPHKGWWGRKESLDTDVFDIKPYSSILKKLNSDLVTDDTHVIILTSRQEKLSPYLEKVLELNDIEVDEVVMKKGNDDKGDIILNKYVHKFPDLKYIVAYDDFAGGLEEKVVEYTKIKKILKSRGIQYKIVKVVNGKVSRLTESANFLFNIIREEILKFK